MGTRDRPTRLFRSAMILIAVLCVAAATPLLAQQAPDSTRVAATVSVQPSAHSTTTPAPQVSERFGRVGPSLERSNVSAASSFAGEGSHTIVISTLALVLIIIIIVLLVR